MEEEVVYGSFNASLDNSYTALVVAGGKGTLSASTLSGLNWGVNANEGQIWRRKKW